MMNKVVVRYSDGRILKGTTADFFPNKEVFHVSLAGNAPDAEPLEVRTPDLKALFFVKDLDGDPQHTKSNEFDPSHPAIGRKIRVVFHDGEVLVGTTTGYQPSRPGFFVEPADGASNNERCFVITAATREVTFV